MARRDSNTGDTQIGLILRSSLNSGAWNVGSALASTAAGLNTRSTARGLPLRGAALSLEIEGPAYPAAMADHHAGDEPPRPSVPWISRYSPSRTPRSARRP